ncbi:dihydrofolate reductase [soil metagenome]
MHSPRISIIVAMSDNRVIGNKGEIPWNIPGEQKRLKEITTPHPLIMGRKTHEAIGRILPGRLNIIVTTDKDYQVEGGEVVHSLSDSIDLASKSDGEEIFIFGGANLYAQALDRVTRLYLTIVHKSVEGDAVFPDYSDFKKVIYQEEKEFEGLKYTYLTLER